MAIGGLGGGGCSCAPHGPSAVPDATGRGRNPPIGRHGVRAAQRGIVVEFSFFSPNYVNAVGDRLWKISPWNVHNNINGIGDIAGANALSLKNGKLLAVHEGLVRKVETELSGFDNLYFEICNEPYLSDVPGDWQGHMAHVIARTERSLGTEHLIAEEFADAADLAMVKDPEWRHEIKSHLIDKRLPESSLLAFHTAQPRVVTDN